MFVYLHLTVYVWECVSACLPIRLRMWESVSVNGSLHIHCVHECAFVCEVLFQWNSVFAPMPLIAGEKADWKDYRQKRDLSAPKNFTFWNQMHLKLTVSIFIIYSNIVIVLVICTCFSQKKWFTDPFMKTVNRFISKWISHFERIVKMND